MPQVGLGATGVLAEVVLQCVPAHQLLEHTFVSTLKVEHKRFAALTGCGPMQSAMYCVAAASRSESSACCCICVVKSSRIGTQRCSCGRSTTYTASCAWGPKCR